MQLKLGQKILKYAPPTAIARNATLLVTRANGARFAALLYKAAKDKNSPTWLKLSRFWQSIGGNPNEWRNAIKEGVKIDYRHHRNRWQSQPIFNYDGELLEYEGYCYDSFEPVSTATATATATPVLVKIIKILKEAGIDPKDAAKGLLDMSKKGFSELAAKHAGKTETVNGQQVINIAPPDIADGGPPKKQGANELLIVGLAVVAIAAIIYME